MKILVFGELCQDKFVYGSSKRLSPEAPVPVFVPEREEVNPGMVGNVVQNLKSICDCDVKLYSQKNQIIKTRFVDDKSNHMFLRVDEGESNIDSFGLTKQIIKEISESDSCYKCRGTSVCYQLSSGFEGEGVCLSVGW